VILGRDAELAEVQRFVDAVVEGPAALILEGVAGIGKTTLWQSGMEFARGRGYRVLSCRAEETEARLSYTGLGDLLDIELPELPAPQKRALDVALLRAEVEGSQPEQRAVSVATLGVVRAFSKSTPVLIAIDDVQWLDAPSAKVLSFAARRLENEAVRLLVTLRAGPLAHPLGLVRTTPSLALRKLSVGPLSLEALTRLVRERLGTSLTHPVLLRLHDISQGNPFFALEIARALIAQGASLEPGQLLPVPDDLRELLGARLAALPREASRALLVVAAAGRPTDDLVHAVTGSAGSLALAEEAGIVARDGEKVGFSHPLLGSTVYAGATLEERRRVHRRLAEVVDDPEEGARHLALAAPGPDPRVAEALDGAGRHARSRGAPDAAAELMELARRLTPPADISNILRRSVDAASYHFDAGDATRATTLLEEAIALAPPGPERAVILFRLASISWLNMPRVQRLAEQAVREAEDDAELLTSIHEHLAWVGIYRGDLSFSEAHAKRSRKWAAGISNAGVQAESTATFGMVEFLRGREANTHMREAVSNQDLGITEHSRIQSTVYTAARTCYGLQLLWAGKLDAARRVLQAEMADYERLGRYVVRDELHCYLAELECRAGNWEIAAAHARDAVEIGFDSGHVLGRGQMLFPRALVAALTGDVEGARSDAEEGLRISLANEDLLSASCNRSVLGLLELSQSRPDAAMAHFERVLSFLDRTGTEEPCVIPCAPDAIEALVALGRLDEAEELTRRLEDQGRSRERPWAVATGGRCRGLLAAARGDVEQSRTLLERAVADHARVRQPFDLARTLLVKGEIERKAKQKRAARSTLEASLAMFEGLGAPLWAERARTGLARIGGVASAPGELTPTEERIAHLVAQGRKNREVADALFISVKTVEANLSRIFHKLGVRSRTELSHRMTSLGGPSNGIPSLSPRSE
jgi:DNA-binding CsgD family transcriptional regulator